MKKSIFLIFLFLIIGCYKSKQRAITIFDTHFETLNGKVKELTEIHKFGDGHEIDLTSFDQRGNAVKTKTTGGCCGNNELDFIYRYNGNGRKIEVIMAAGDRQQSYKCDTNGRLAEERFNTQEYAFDKQDFAKRKEVFKYDNRGDLSESASYNDTNRFYFAIHKHNLRHFITDVKEFSGTKTLLIRVIYYYPVIDRNGNWLKQIASITHYLKDNKEVHNSVSNDTVERKITYY